MLTSLWVLFVGRLGIVDHDVVELNNMHRQVLVLKMVYLYNIKLLPFCVLREKERSDYLYLDVIDHSFDYVFTSEMYIL